MMMHVECITPIKFKTTMLKSSFNDYSDTYILFNGPISVANTAAADADANNENIKQYLKISSIY